MEKKIMDLLVIKLFALLLFVNCISAGGAFAQDNQELLVDLGGDEFTELQESNASSSKLFKIIQLKAEKKILQEVLQDIADQAGLELSYSEQLMPLTKKINIKQTTLLTAKQALWKVLEGTSLRFGVSSSGQLFFFERRTEEELPLQVETVTGQVTDAGSGETLPGVNVILKGTPTTGTSTDADGRYSLSVPSLQDTLRFSFVGYQTQEVPIDGRTEVNVSLQVQTYSGEDVVVVGYGTQERSDVTGSVSSISTEDFNPGVNTSVDQLMQGRASGVQIRQTSGEPGGGLSIRIRGSNSINASNEPLYVIDGQPINNSDLISNAGSAGLGDAPSSLNPLTSLSPSDIESIEILKDASATSIYGARGANGVILITTKEGRFGELSVNYDGYFGFQQTERKLDILNTQEYINVINGTSEDAGNSPVFTQEDISRIGEGTNWQNELFRTAPVNNHNIALSGGSESTTYRASLNYMNQDGLLKTSGIQKYVARLNIDTDLSENIRAGININRSVVDRNNNFDGVSEHAQGGPISAALFYDPTDPIYDSEGNFTESSVLSLNNPVSLLEGVSNTSKLNRTFGRIYIQHDILSNLSGRLDFGYDQQDNKRKIYNSTMTINGAAAGGIASIATLDIQHTNLQYTLNYNAQLSENHSLNALTGVTYEQFSNDLFSGTIQGFTSDLLGTNNLEFGDTNFDDLSSNLSENTLLSYLGRVNYSFKDTYLVTASLRVDGSSKFGPNYKYGYFPSVALGWKLAQEDFIPEIFNELKLRLSWGMTGNQDIQNNAYLATFASGSSASFNNTPYSTVTPSRIANPNLKWEATEEYNIGVDASILENRISGSINYYNKTTSDILVNMPLPVSSGYESILTNVGKMGDQGLEFHIDSNNLSTTNFNWNTTLSFTTSRNEVKDLGGVGSILFGAIGNSPVDNNSIVRVGDPIFSYYGYRADGIFQSESEIASSAQPNAEPGHPRFYDANGDGAINPEDRVLLGKPYPDFTFGISNSFSFKNWELDFFINASQGTELLNLNILHSLYPKNPRRNLVADVGLNRWTPQNTDTKWPSGVNPTSYAGGVVNSLSIEDASFIRLQSARLAYNIPQNFVRSATVYLTGQNLITFTGYSGTNPEANALGRSNVRLDFSGYPLARTFLVGVNLQF